MPARSQLRVEAGLVPPEVDGDVVDEPPGDFGIDAAGRLAAMRADER
jgi:hypothetical protein